MFRIRLLEGEWYCGDFKSQAQIRKDFEKRGVEFSDNFQEVFLPKHDYIKIGSDYINNAVLFKRGSGVYSVEAIVTIHSSEDIQMMPCSRDPPIVFRDGLPISKGGIDEIVQLREGDVLQIQRNKIKLLEMKI